jgi:CheY-like chemotaxis protein
MAQKVQIGDLLVQAGIISVKTLERALEMQKGSGKKIGALLRDMGIVTEEEVVEALAKQCSLKTVRNFADHPFPRELLDLVPANLAVEKIIFPLKQHQGTLAIATIDPFDRDTFDYLANKTGMKIYPVLATRDNIFAAVKKHFLKETPKKSDKTTLLLIDDSPLITQILEPVLAREGYEVIVSADGVDGLKQAFSSHPALIICDLMMPRMDGYKFMQALKAHPETTDVPVILMTSKASAEEEHRALKAGFVDFIGKPAMPVRVLTKVKMVLATQERKRKAAQKNQ